MKEINEFIEKHTSLLPLGNSISFTEAEKRAATFLNALAYITDCRHLLSSEKIKLTSLQSVTYAEELSKCTGKTITENKVTVEANANYIRSREDLESLENDLNYLKAYYDIFTSAHVFYRQMARGDNA